MKLVCRDCKYEQIVQDRSLTQCPKCGSKNIKIFLFGTPGRQGKILGTSCWCSCLCELLIPLILFLILVLMFIGSV